MKLYRIQAFVKGSYLNGNVEATDDKAALLRFVELVEQGKIKVNKTIPENERGFHADNRVRLTYEEFANVATDGTRKARLRAQMGSVGYEGSTGRNESGVISDKRPEDTN